MVENILITGGCGFIGRNLIAALRESGYAIRVLDNLSVGTLQDLQKVAPVEQPDPVNCSIPSQSRVQLIVGDITDPDLTRRACANINAVVHLAANTGVGPSVENPLFDCQQNVIGTANVLEAARMNGTSRFIFASSGAPAGEVEPPIHEEIVPKPVSPYGASKLAGEAYCSAYFRTFGIDTVALRFGNVYGPGSGHKSSLVAKFFNRALDGLPLEIYGDGTQTRDFIYIGDLVNAVQKALQVPGVGGEVFQIATSSETTVNEIAEKILTVIESRGIALPELRFSEPRLGDVMRNYSDTSKAKSVLAWEAKCEMIQGLENTLDAILQSRH
ncbi:MAG: NAD-dependent epimerase/dehydratase family protein [Gammaproteobacteria bacterium]|nr:NAD-dependent epimerase/dehydratase family protein [Gammaproteobacteria bacterium]